MLWHVLRFDMVDAPLSDREELTSALQQLSGVPQVEEIHVGAACNAPDVIGMVMRLSSSDDLAAYHAHPIHKRTHAVIQRLGLKAVVLDLPSE